MNLIKQKIQWKKWAREEGLDSQSTKQPEPLEYPCFAYCTVLSFGYEEKRANYIYLVSLEDMLSEIKGSVA